MMNTYLIYENIVEYKKKTNAKKDNNSRNKANEFK